MRQHAVLAVLAAAMALVDGTRAAGGGVRLPQAAVAPAPPDASTLGAWWDVNRVPLPDAPLITHADVLQAAERAVTLDPDRLARAEIGRSVEGRPLIHLRIGRGPAAVLLWSQMHGDEPSATPALFDLLEWLRRERETPVVRRLLDRLTMHLVPMLNPDGAERVQRRNAQGIDVNRDALRLQTPEGRALAALRDRVAPVLGFNLHNQNLQTSVGRPPRPATISLLAVAHDEARSTSPRRRLAKQTAAVVRDVLEPLIPGQIGRYSDEFEVRAFGDDIARQGTGVLLIETGALAGADMDRRLTRLNFIALVTALDALASGRTAKADPGRYESLPQNDGLLLHTLIAEASVLSGTGIPAFTADIGITAGRSVVTRDGQRTLQLAARIADLGDLRVYGALDRIDGTGLTALPMIDPSLKVGDELQLPEWSRWTGATLSVGQPGALLLVAPAPGRAGWWRVERVIDPSRR
jgi:hypothetical protein